MFFGRVLDVCARIPKGKLVILYSNGLLFTPDIARRLEAAGVRAVNVGLHYPRSFHNIIRRVNEATKDTKLNVRFHVWDRYRILALERIFPEANFRYWVMDDCERDNEERVVLQ